jgi:phosphatidylserine/phosphatidylglycerophosphate/cardiolipin synthase-like enzyme
LEGVLLAHERRLAQSARRGRTEVVRTQPLHVGLDGLDTATAVRQVFAQAEREVLVAGFRLTDGVIFEPLRRAAGGALRVRLFVDLDARVDVFGRSQPAQDPARWPARWREEFLRRVWPAGLEAPEMFYAPVTLEGSGPGGASMHAKTVIADRRRWLVGSANFTGRAQTRNFELGVMLEDEKAADKAIRWFEALVLAGDFVPL